MAKNAAQKRKLVSIVCIAGVLAIAGFVVFKRKCCMGTKFKEFSSTQDSKVDLVRNLDKAWTENAHAWHRYILKLTTLAKPTAPESIVNLPDYLVYLVDKHFTHKQAQELQALLNTKYLPLLQGYIKALQGDNRNEIRTYTRELTEVSAEMGTVLNTVNAHWKAAQFVALIKEYHDTIAQMIHAQAKKHNLEEDDQLLEQLMINGLALSGYFSLGLIEQFPDSYKNK